MKSSILATSFVLAASALMVGQFNAVAGEGGTAGGSTDCASAPALSIGNNSFDTSGSTVSVALPAARGCAGHTVFKANYFTFTPSTSGTYVFSTCGTSWDTRLAVLSSCSTAAAAVLQCSDDSCGYQASLSLALSANTTYRVLVGGFGAADGGVGALSVATQAAGSGADVIVGDLVGISNYAAVTVNGVSVGAYAIGTTSCNIGTAQLQWFASPDNRHPFIPQNMYRLRGGRLEQIGMGWGKHGFTALQGTVCGSCTSSGTGSYLGIGCSDPYSSGLNGSQSGLGTRSEVNAATGVFPGTINVGMPTAGTSIHRRIQVARPDLDPALNAGAIFLAEGHYIAQDDAAAGNDDNNCSWRTFSVGSLNANGAYNLTFTNATQRQQPAIHAWKTFDASVRLANVDVPGDGRFAVAHTVKDNGNGTWRYEYAIQNINSHRSGNSFSIPVPAGVTVTNAGFKDIDYHSGDPYAPTNWSIGMASGRITWTGADFANAPNGNALRFATLYNFWFDASAAPVDANGTLGLFRPGTAGAPNWMEMPLRAPGGQPTNPADLNGDGQVNADDLGELLSQWGTKGTADLNGDNWVDGIDLGQLLGAWT
ncbi:MAG: hypothetical protein FGM39_02900 [Phycisphaerales bacterium]|nr:hypothetical protein [Phycisphaerales bacterium]